MRRKDRETSREEALKVVDCCSYAVMSVVALNGEPYCVPLSIVRINEAIYFHCAKSGKKSDALENNPRACVVCVGDVKPMKDEFSTEYESAIIIGSALKVTNEAEKEEALKELCLRYTPENMRNFESELQRSAARTDVWKITIEQITGKAKKLPSCKSNA